MDLKPEITWLDFEKLDIRCGTIISVADFRKPENSRTKSKSTLDRSALRNLLLKLHRYTGKTILLANRF